MLKITNLTKTYAKNIVKAVDNISLEVKEGEIFGFLGPNGAGKSTTIKMITGILQPDSGSIELNGINIAQEPYVYKHNFGFVPDNHATFEKLTGMEYINFMGTIYDVPVADVKTRAEQLIAKFNLQDAINDQISTYSHGMKQKIVVIGALLHQPKLWILDEPLTGLDPQSSFELKQNMRDHADAGNIVFFSSHVIEVVEKVCDRIAIIKNGQILKVGTVESIVRESGMTLEEYFLSVTAR